MAKLEIFKEIHSNILNKNVIIVLKEESMNWNMKTSSIKFEIFEDWNSETPLHKGTRHHVELSETKYFDVILSLLEDYERVSMVTKNYDKVTEKALKNFKNWN